MTTRQALDAIMRAASNGRCSSNRHMQFPDVLLWVQGALRCSPVEAQRFAYRVAGWPLPPGLRTP